MPSDLVENIHNRSIFLFGLRDKFLCLHEIIWNPSYSQLDLEKSHEISIFSSQIRWILHFLSILLSEAMNAPCFPARPRRYQQQIPSACTVETRKAQESATQQGLLAFLRITIVTIISYVCKYNII